METVTVCPVCSGNSFSPFLACKDYLVSQETFQIQQCNTCGFRLTNPRPDSQSISAYYKSEQYVSHNDESSGVINTAYRVVRNYTLRAKLNLITTLNQGQGKLLDVGCGTGAFLEICKRAGWQITGMEPDREARLIAQKKLVIPIKSDIHSVPTSSSFDIITLWHVLEHIPDLNATITLLNERLSSNGTLVIAVPNSNSYDANYFKECWAAYDLPRHLYHFTPASICALFAKHDLKLIEQKPMLFDAFYISLLSTRYMSGTTDYIKSVQLGLTSNRQAKQTGNASSLIYLFRKA